MISSIRVLLLASCLVAASLSGASAWDNGLARTPQMGWNSWNFFKCSINEEVIRSIAAAMVDTGLHSHGVTSSRHTRRHQRVSRTAQVSV